MKLFLLFVTLSAAAFAADPAQDAIDALRGLRSVTEVGTNFRDYSTRVLDTKVKVDKYLANAPKDDQRAKIESAMTLYVLAYKAWAARLQRHHPEGVGEAIMANPQFATCGDMPQLIAKATEASEHPWWETDKSLSPKQRAAMHRSTPAELLGNQLSDTPGALWKCAAALLP